MGEDRLRTEDKVRTEDKMGTVNRVRTEDTCGRTAACLPEAAAVRLVAPAVFQEQFVGLMRTNVTFLLLF